MENTGQVTESGSSTVKHALNPDKAFMQVHYLKVRQFFLKNILAENWEVPKEHLSLYLNSIFSVLLNIYLPVFW